MTASLQPLTTLLGQAERERDEARAALARATESERQAQAQAVQLVAYRAEYEQRWSERFRAGGRIEVVHCYRSFMDRLGQALQQQQHVARLATQQLEHARARLTEAELRVGSVRKLLERRRQELQAVAERQEQKQTDEFAARRAWGGHPGAAVLASRLVQPA